MEANFVIIGAGSAGCAMAYRLSEDEKNSVIIIEYGGSDMGPLIQMPAALSYPMNMKTYDWGFQSEPEPYLKNRRLATPRGKVLGGSSSINGMVYVRGHAKDYDYWEQSGAFTGFYKIIYPIGRQSKKRLEEAIRLFKEEKETYLKFFEDKGITIIKEQIKE